MPRSRFITSSQSSPMKNSSPFFSLLQVLFIGLKITGYISWPWWQVLLPTLIPLGVVITGAIIILIIKIVD